MSEVAEESAEFRHAPTTEGAFRFRRIAGIGPAYEILEDRGEFVHVRVLHNDEEFDYRRVDCELDPPA